jgi:hypothetical protein
MYLCAMTAKPKEQFTLRLPSDLHAQLNAAREQSGRTLTAEIIARLRASFEGAFSPLPESVSTALKERAETLGTSFDIELARAASAGLNVGAPAVLMLTVQNGITLKSAEELLRAARKQLPPDTTIEINLG